MRKIVQPVDHRAPAIALLTAGVFRPSPWAVAALVVSACAAAGCHHQVYTAGDLPAEFEAAPVRRARDLDLTQLARPTALSDRVHPGDVLEVSVSTGLEEGEAPRWTLRVADDGTLGVPLVGPVKLAGLELGQADQAIHRAGVARGIYRNPNVSVERKGQRTNSITVVGAVAEPGLYRLPRATSDVLSAIVAAGGLADNADTLIEIRQPAWDGQGRNDPRVAQLAAHQVTADDRAGYVSQVDLVRAHELSHVDFSLEDGAVVTVREKPTQTIFVLGKVNEPNQFEMPPDQDVHLLDALAMAGGRSLELADKAYVVRRLPEREEPILIEASIGEAKRNAKANIKLAPGDVVSVEETPLTFTIDTLRQFIRLGLSTTIF